MGKVKDNSKMDSKISDLEVKYDYFSDYVEIFNNLDNILWKMPAFFATLSTAVIGIISLMNTKTQLISTSVLGVLFFIIGIIFVVGSYTMYRIMIQHIRIIFELAKMEYASTKNKGYFYKRKESIINSKIPLSATLFISIFNLFGTVLFLGGISILNDNLLIGIFHSILKKHSFFFVLVMIGLILINEYLIRIISKKRIE